MTRCRWAGRARRVAERFGDMPRVGWALTGRAIGKIGAALGTISELRDPRPVAVLELEENG
jgi:hypothetical protein